MARIHPRPPSGDKPSPASSALAVVPAAAAQTMLGLQVLIGSETRLPLDPEWIARELFPGVPLAMSTDRVIRDVLVLEEAGHVRSWAQSGREWLALTSPRHPGRPEPFSTAWEREKEGERERAQERAREDARQRARARIAQEDLEDAETWTRWDIEHSRPTAAPRPERPALLRAPPLGCPDHPEGTFEECGPCGTAITRRKMFLARQRYEQQLSVFEEQQWEGFASDPF